MTGGVFYGDRTALAGGQNGEAVKAGRIGNCFKITHPTFEGDIANGAIRETTPARIVTKKRVRLGKMFKPGTPGQAVPLMLQVREPGCRHDQRRASPGHTPGDPDAIRTGAEANLLFHEPPWLTSIPETNFGMMRTVADSGFLRYPQADLRLPYIGDGRRATSGGTRRLPQRRPCRRFGSANGTARRVPSVRLYRLIPGIRRIDPPTVHASSCRRMRVSTTYLCRSN